MTLVKVRRFLAQQPNHVAISVLKSLGHAWTTSSRMHESEVLPCFLGCPGALDTQEHYMACERFWRLVCGSRFSARRFGPRSILGRSGLYPFSADALRELCVASKFYHHVKHGGLLLVQCLFALANAGDIATLAALASMRCKQQGTALNYVSVVRIRSTAIFTNTCHVS